VIIGSLVMAAGALVIALSSVSADEHAQWERAAAAQGDQYGVDPAWRKARMVGDHAMTPSLKRTWIDWLIVGAATAIIGGFAVVARAPQIAVQWSWVTVLAVVMVAMLVASGLALWRTTRFS
jgi:hypothetical protein